MPEQADTYDSRVFGGQQMQRAQTQSKLTRLRYERVLTLVKSLGVLPTTMRTPMRILELQRQPDADSRDFASALQADPAIATKVLSLANSAFFAPVTPITRLSDAVSRVGLRNLVPLVFSLALAGIFNRTDLPPSQRNMLWKVSLAKGCIAQQWMAQNRKDSEEEAFLCGIMQDLALPIMFAADQSAVPELSAVIDQDEQQRPLREQQLYGTDHAQLGRAVLVRMALPEPYPSATATHHDAAGPQLPPAWQDLAPALRLAAALPHSMARLASDSAARLRTRFCEISGEGGDSQQFDELLKGAADRADRAEAMLPAHDEGGSTVKAFLRDVCEQVAHSLFCAIGESSRTIDRLQSSERNLQQRVTDLEKQLAESDLDPLTRVLTRQAFGKWSVKVLSMARTSSLPCGIGFVDLDQFKSINDTHGHAVGDTALRALAKTLHEAVHPRGLVGRVGGDEFAFVVVGGSQAEPAVIADQIGCAVDGTGFSAGDQTLTVRASFGLLWLGVPRDDINIDHALHLSDELMYTAKRKAGPRRTVAHYTDGSPGYQLIQPDPTPPADVPLPQAISQ